MRKYFILKTMIVLLLFSGLISCDREEVKVIEIDSVWGLSLFHDNITVGDALNLMDSTWNTWLSFKPNGDLYARYSDTLDKVLDAKDILWGIPNVDFSASDEFELPALPPIPGFHYSIDMPNLVSVPFTFDGFEINEAGIRDGFMTLTLSSSLNIIDTVLLSSSNIKMGDGSDFSCMFTSDGYSFSGTIDMAGCVLIPDENGDVIFSGLLALTFDDTSISGMQNFDINVTLEDLKFASVEGVFSELSVRYSDIVDIDFGLENVSGSLEFYTPKLSLGYINTLGMSTDCYIDSLYLGDDLGGKTTILKNWEPLELDIHVTDENAGYESFVVDEQVVDMLDLIEEYSCLAIAGDVSIAGDNDVARMTDDSYVSLVAELEIPIKYKVTELIYEDAMDFDLTTSLEGEDLVFDELEVKLGFENGLPMQIVPQVYFLQDNVVIDSLILSNNIVTGSYDGTVVKSDIIIPVTGERFDKVVNANRLGLKLLLSTDGHEVEMNTMDSFGLRIGAKLKTSTISTDDFNL